MSSMHTVVFGWFGGSAVWFIALFWRLVRSALPGGVGLRGPGTIRLWLGFICVLVASCTLEASLIDIVGVDGLGHALAGGFGKLLGHIGTPLAMLALLVLSLPWLIDFRWSSVAAWADGAFGLGLSRGLARRDEDARRRGSSSDDARANYASTPANTMTPGNRGRYARPTVWRPPASKRAAAGASGTVAGAGTDAFAADPRRATSAAGANRQAKDAAARSEPTAAERAARMRTSTALRQASARAQDAPGSAGVEQPAPWMPAEPVAPDGWLRDPAAATRKAAPEQSGVGAGGVAAHPGSARPGADDANAAGSVIGRARVDGTGVGAAAGSATSRPVGRPSPLGAAMAAPGVSTAAGASKTFAAGLATQAIASGSTASPSRTQATLTSRGAKPMRPNTLQTPTRSSPQSAPGAAARSGLNAPQITQTPRSPVGPSTRAPSFSRPPAATQQVAPPASVQETLRSIEENAARWTTIAGASLARREGPEVVRYTTDTSASPVTDDKTADAGHARSQSATSAKIDGAGSTPTVVDASAAHAQSAGQPPREPVSTSAVPPTSGQASVATLAEDAVTMMPTVDATAAPIEAPLPHHESAASTGRAELAAFTASNIAIEAPAEVQTEAHATAPLNTATSAEAPVHPAHAQQPASGEADSTLSHAEAAQAEPAHAEPAPAQTPSLSNVVRFPGYAASAAAHASSTTSSAAQLPHVESPVTHHSSATSLYAIADDIAKADLPDEPDAAGNDDHSITPVNPGFNAPFPITRHEPANEPVAPRPPVSGHAPTVFEFHAPTASAVELPTLDLLARADTDVEPVSEERLAETGQLIEQRLQEFKVPVTVVGASAGPVITRFEVEPALGVRGSQIVGLMKDLSRGLGLTSIRVVETIPGKTCMGLELPNAKRQTIRLSEILEANVYQHSHSMLTLAMGKDITGHPVIADLAKAPHMLVAGTTGSGKSVAINAMIVSLLYKATPEEVRLIMIDPKMLELSVYEGIPHLLAPVVTDMKLAANALNWCVGEMEKRYRLMSAVGVRNLAGFNQKIRDAEAAGKKLGNPFSLTPEAPEPLAALPLIVVVIDELADLMMVAGKKIEELIARLAQKARAAGIHLILATQRPSVDVITGLIKANIPTRVAFQVSSKIDSRTILDQMGAESLLGQGDMLFLPPGTGYPQRVHGAFVADEEVHRIVEYLKQFGEPQYEEGILDGPATEGATQDLFGDAPDAEADPLYDEAVAFVVRTRRASISSVQRQLRIGYNRAARLVEQMETAGLVSSMGINGSREVLAPGPAE